MRAGKIRRVRAITKFCQLEEANQLFQIRKPLIVKKIATPRTGASSPPKRGTSSGCPAKIKP
jgi:hypothetical protein